MENTNTPLSERLDRALEDKRNKDSDVRRQQMMALQGIVLKCSTQTCPNCGARLFPFTKAENEDGEDDGRC